jgi:hypothetical protein
MRLLQLHTWITWLSINICLAIFIGEVFIQPKGFIDLGYIDYVIPTIFLVFLTGFYLCVFKWNQRLQQNQHTDLFIPIFFTSLTMLLLALITLTIRYEDAFPKERIVVGTQLLFEEILGNPKDDNVTFEKSMFFLYAAFTVTLLFLLTITIIAHRKSIKAAYS